MFQVTANDIVAEHDLSDSYHVHRTGAALAMLAQNYGNWVYTGQNSAGAFTFKHPQDQAKLIAIVTFPDRRVEVRDI